LESVSVAFQPSVYGGTGEEARKGIVFRITAEDYNELNSLEQWVPDALRASNPNVDALWSPSARKSDKRGCQLKCKMNLEAQGSWIGTNFYN